MPRIESGRFTPFSENGPFGKPGILRGFRNRSPPSGVTPRTGTPRCVNIRSSVGKERSPPGKELAEAGRGWCQQRSFSLPFPYFSDPDDTVSRKNDTIICKDACIRFRLTGINLFLTRKCRAAAQLQGSISIPSGLQPLNRSSEKNGNMRVGGRSEFFEREWFSRH